MFYRSSQKKIEGKIEETAKWKKLSWGISWSAFRKARRIIVVLVTNIILPVSQGVCEATKSRKGSRKWRDHRISHGEMAVILPPLIRWAPYSDYIPLSFDEHRWLPSTRQSAITALVRIAQCAARVARSLYNTIIIARTSTGSAIALNQLVFAKKW